MHLQAAKFKLIGGAEVEDKRQTEAREVHELWLRFRDIASLQFKEAFAHNSSGLVMEKNALVMNGPTMRHARGLMKSRLDERHETAPRDRHAFTSDLLLQFEKSRATDPRDRVFALEGFMLPALGHLLRVDYGRAVESVFKRECARFFNTQGGFKTGIHFFNLLGERGVKNDTSWTLDLGIDPSDASQNENFGLLGAQNLGMAICWSHENQLLRPGRSLEDIRNLSVEQPGIKFYITPRTLFCGGMRIDRVRYAFKIPSFDTDEPLTRFASLLREVGLKLTEPLRDGNNGSSCLGYQNVRDLGDDFWLNSGAAALFSLSMPKGEFEKLSNEELSDILNHKIGGKYCFITRKGLIGLCYCAVETNDEIAALDQSHVMFMLRRSGQSAGGAPRHRILSRTFIFCFTRLDADKLLEQGKLAVEQYQII